VRARRDGGRPTPRRASRAPGRARLPLRERRRPHEAREGLAGSGPIGGRIRPPVASSGLLWFRESRKHPGGQAREQRKRGCPERHEHRCGGACPALPSPHNIAPSHTHLAGGRGTPPERCRVRHGHRRRWARRGGPRRPALRTDTGDGHWQRLRLSPRSPGLPACGWSRQGLTFGQPGTEHTDSAAPIPSAPSGAVRP
jgi:hypothetical protein